MSYGDHTARTQQELYRVDRRQVPGTPFQKLSPKDQCRARRMKHKVDDRKSANAGFSEAKAWIAERTRGLGSGSSAEPERGQSSGVMAWMYCLQPSAKEV